jgi:HPt (histidine-containing phosphotransfer) domain-containing protein
MSTTAILDPQAIESLRAISPDDGNEFFNELIDIYLADTPARITEIEQALAAQNAPDLVRAAHSIKGSSSNFGASELAAIASDMEHKGKTGAFAEVAARLPTLKEAFGRLRPALLELKNGG